MRSAHDIATYLVLLPYPQDSRCGCPVCPDCREGAPGDRCGNSDGSDWNCAEWAGFLNPGPTELGSTWDAQTDAMRARSATELDELPPEYEDYEVPPEYIVSFFAACGEGDCL